MAYCLTHMKKNFILSIILFITITAHSQPGENIQLNYSMISDVQSTLKSAIGWSMQDNGRWASAKNSILFTDSRTNKSASELRRLGQENFIIMELKKALIDNKQYNVLIIKYKDGEYEFPLIQDGWRSYKSLEFYVFKAENLNKVLPKDVIFNKPYAVNLDVFCNGIIKKYNPQFVDDKIVNKIQATLNSTNVNASNLIFAVYPIQSGEKEVVKFKLIRSFSKKSLYAWYMDPNNWAKLFNNSYYEARYYKFKKFIRDSQVYNIPTVDNPTTFTAFYSWGILKYQAGNYDEAIFDFDEAIKLNPDTTVSMIYSYRGIAKYKLQDFSGSIEDFDKAIEIRPTDVMEYSNWIKNYFNRGVSKFYTNDLEGACEDWNKAFELGFGISLDYLNKYCSY